MTRAFQGEELARFIQRRFPDAELEWDGDSLWIEPQRVREVARFLKEEPQLVFNFLNAVSAVDYIEHFEVVYHLTSFEHNHSAVLKTRVYGRENLSVPSVVEVWPGADFQERATSRHAASGRLDDRGRYRYLEDGPRHQAHL